MARKKQIEKHGIDYSGFWKIDLPTNYPAYTNIPKEKLEEGKTKMWIQMQKFKRDRELKEGC